MRKIYACIMITAMIFIVCGCDEKEEKATYKLVNMNEMEEKLDNISKRIEEEKELSSENEENGEKSEKTNSDKRKKNGSGENDDDFSAGGKGVVGEGGDAVSGEVNEDDFAIDQSFLWDFTSSGKGSNDVYVKNNEENKYPLRFKVKTSDGKVIYQSGILQRGEEVKGFNLDSPLSHGDYKCIVYYEIIKGDDPDYGLNGMTSNVKIHIN